MKPTTPQRDENGRGGFVGATWQVAPTEVPICDDCGYFQGSSWHIFIPRLKDGQAYVYRVH